MAKILNEDEEDDLSSLSTLTPSDGGRSRSGSPASVRSNQKIMDDDPNLPSSSKKVTEMEKKQQQDQPTSSNKIEKNESRKSSSGSSSESDDDEELFEVEKIMAHKIEDGRKLWKIRWHGYTEAEDTWEPRENLIIGEQSRQLLEEYEQKLKENRIEKRRKTMERKKQLKEQRLSLEEQRKKKADEKESSDEEEDLNGSNVEGWFGIKKGEGNVEQKRLFVADRRLSKTEKLLTEINSSPGVRILRNHLKQELMSDKDKSSTPTPSRKRARKSLKGSSAKKGRPLIAESQTDVFTSEGSPATRIGEKKKRRKKSAKIEDVKVEEGIVPAKKKEEEDLTFKKEEKLGEEKIVKINVDDLRIDQAKLKKTEELDLEKKPTSSKKLEKTNEFGISKHLTKPPVIKRTSAKKLPSSSSSASISHAPKPQQEDQLSEKKKQEKKPKKEVVDLSLKTMPTGTNIVGEIDKFLKKVQKVDGGNAKECTQQEFEEIVLDGKAEKVRELLLLNAQNKFLNLDQVDEHGKTLIHKLCEIRCGVTHTQCELIDLLVTKGARLDLQETDHGQIPLHIAIANRRICHVQKLLSLQSPINVADRNGKTPILLALESSDHQFMRFLLRVGASFHIAVEKVCRDIDKYRRQKKILDEHENRLRKAMNSARDTATKNMNTKCISQIFVNPIHERQIQQNFQLSTQPQLPGDDQAYVIFVAIAHFVDDNRDKEFCSTIEAKMWGRNPITAVWMNGKECVQLNNVAYFCVPKRDQNQIKIQLDPTMMNMMNTNMILLSQVALVQFYG